MNKPISAEALHPHPLASRSPALEALLQQIAQGEASRERDRILPHEAIDLIRQARLGALRIPRVAGGGGASIRELFDIVIRLAAADVNVAHILRNHFSIAERFVSEPQDQQNRKWRQDVVDGAIIGVAATELGSPTIGNSPPSTLLTSDGSGYLLSGTKYYSTGTLYADYVLVRAADQNGQAGSAIIPVAREGIELVDDWEGFGQRLTGSGTTVFQNVRVERDEVLFDSPTAGYGVPYANTFAQLYLTAAVAGILSAVERDAIALVRGRGRNFYYAPAERAADDPLIQETIGQIASNAFAAKAVILAAAEALDLAFDAWNPDRPDSTAAHDAAVLAAKAKVIVDDLTIRSAGLLFDVGGASATRRDDNLDRHWRNARTIASHNPRTHKAQAIGSYAVNRTPLPAKGFF